MTREEFKDEFEIIFDKPKTVGKKTSKVRFDQRAVSLRRKSTGEILKTGVEVTTGSEAFAEGLAYEWFSKKLESSQ